MAAWRDKWKSRNKIIHRREIIFAELVDRVDARIGDKKGERGKGNKLITIMLFIYFFNAR